MRHRWIVTATFLSILSILLSSCQRSETADVQGPIDSGGESTPKHRSEMDSAGTASVGMPPIMQQITAYKKRLEENPEDLEALIYLGNANYDIQRFEKAIEYYDRALAIDERNTHVRTDLASSLRQIGQVDSAVEQLQRVLDQDPNQEVALYNLGVILLNDRGDIEEARKSWKKLIAIYRVKQAKYSVLSEAKRKFIKAFGTAMFQSDDGTALNIEAVGRASGIPPEEYHLWIREDPLFSEALANAKDGIIADELEKKILELEKGPPPLPTG